MQGLYPRLYTALGLGVIAAAGVWRGYESSIEYTPLWRLGIPAALALVLGWAIFRIIHFPPFAEFLIATEAEMNKVSWTSKDDLYRASTVVLSTVLLMAIFLFVVDWLWLFILRNIGVLQFTGGGGFGSTASSSRPSGPDAPYCPTGFDLFPRQQPARGSRATL